MVPRAYLRMFEPLDAFASAEREWWGTYVAHGSGVTRGEAEASEDHVATVRLITGRGPLQTESALVRRVGRRVHVCPLQLELRAAAALRSFKERIPLQVVDAFLPDPWTRDTLEELGRDGRSPHIRESPWTVPLAWFALFEPGERHFVDPPEGRGVRLTYLTAANQAAERLERAIEIVEGRIEDAEDVLVTLADLSDWVDEFDPHSIIELDYASLVRLRPPALLAEDHTCEDVWRALESLSDGDEMAAAAYYGVARGRWATLRELQSVN